jgi:hypothetical protein
MYRLINCTINIPINRITIITMITIRPDFSTDFLYDNRPRKRCLQPIASHT